MELVRFFLGELANYDTDTHEYGLYFTTDTKELYLNGMSIGNRLRYVVNLEDLVQLVLMDGTNVILSAATTEAAGVMTASDKETLSKIAAIAAGDTSITISDDVLIAVLISQSDTNNLSLTDDGLYVPIYTAGEGIEIENQEISATNSLSNIEKEWIEQEVFETYFDATISSESSSYVYDGTDYTITFTLTTTYNGENVELDEVPDGWTYSSTGIYTKDITVTSSTGNTVSSDSVDVTYDSRSTTISSISITNIKYSYILTSTDSTLTSIDDMSSATTMSFTNDITGTYSITVGLDEYVYFIISSTSTLNTTTQLGLNYLSSESYTLERTNYGTYTIYRSANAMSAGTQTITVA